MSKFFDRLQLFWDKQKNQFIEKSNERRRDAALISLDLGFEIGNDILNDDYEFESDDVEYWRDEVKYHYKKWLRSREKPNESERLVALANLVAVLDMKLTELKEAHS